VLAGDGVYIVSGREVIGMQHSSLRRVIVIPIYPRLGTPHWLARRPD